MGAGETDEWNCRRDEQRTAEVNCLWVVERQMDRTTGRMNEDLLRLTVCGCWRDRWIELQEG